MPDWSKIIPKPLTFPVPDWPEEKFAEVIAAATRARERIAGMRMNIALDTDTELQCESCERPIEPGEPKLIVGFIEPHGRENWIMPYCAKCGEAFRD